MTIQLTPDPYRCDCRFITEQDAQSGAICGVHNDGRGFYYQPPELMPWE